jgi:hypothetical protein
MVLGWKDNGKDGEWKNLNRILFVENWAKAQIRLHSHLRQLKLMAKDSALNEKEC